MAHSPLEAVDQAFSLAPLLAALRSSSSTTAMRQPLGPLGAGLKFLLLKLVELRNGNIMRHSWRYIPRLVRIEATYSSREVQVHRNEVRQGLIRAKVIGAAMISSRGPRLGVP